MTQEPTRAVKTRSSQGSQIHTSKNTPDRDETFRKLRDLGDDALGDVLTAYRKMGGSVGWRPSDVAIMAEAITRVEDAWELRKQTDRIAGVRAGLRDLRRRLES